MTWRIAAIILALAVPLSVANAADRTLVFAAASMKDAVEALARTYGEESGVEIVVSVASSGTLARQIEAGAPADIFVSANPQWMDYLDSRNLIEPASRENLAGNRLVAVSSEEGGVELKKHAPEDLLKAERFAMGDPGHVPAGHYALQALSELGLWEALQPKAVFGENVRVSLALAARGEVNYAIVYGSDALMQDNVVIVYTFPADTHEPIVYPAALTPAADEEAKAFFAFLFSTQAQDVLASFGFVLPSNSGSDS